MNNNYEINGKTYTKGSDGKFYQDIDVFAQETPRERGILGEVIPTLGAIGGEIAGAAVGGFPGAVAGGAGGGAFGEFAQQGIENIQGKRDGFDLGQVAAQGATSGVLVPFGIGLAKAGSKIFGVASASVKPFVLQTMGKFSGYSPEIIEKALSRSPGVRAGIESGEIALSDVINKTSSGLSSVARDAKNASIKAVNSFNKLSVGKDSPGLMDSMFKESKDFIRQTISRLNNQYNIGMKSGQLVFDRSDIPSNIVATSDRNTLQNAYDTIKTIKNNVSIKHIDAVLEKLIVLRSKTPAGSPTGPETKAIVGEMMDHVIDFVRNSGTRFGKGYAQYTAYLEENLKKRVMIEDMKELFGTSAHLSPREIAVAQKRLLSIFNAGNLPIRSAAEDIGTLVGQDITETAAGTIMKTGEEFNLNLNKMNPRNIYETILQALPRKILSEYVKTGKITGSLLENPVIKWAANTLNVSTKDIVNTVLLNKKDR